MEVIFAWYVRKVIECLFFWFARVLAVDPCTSSHYPGIEMFVLKGLVYPVLLFQFLVCKTYNSFIYNFWWWFLKTFMIALMGNLLHKTIPMWSDFVIPFTFRSKIPIPVKPVRTRCSKLLFQPWILAAPSCYFNPGYAVHSLVVYSSALMTKRNMKSIDCGAFLIRTVKVSSAMKSRTFGLHIRKAKSQHGKQTTWMISS